MKFVVFLIACLPTVLFASMCLPNPFWAEIARFQIQLAEKQCWPRPGLAETEVSGYEKRLSTVSYGIFGAKGKMRDLSEESQRVVDQLAQVQPCTSNCEKKGQPTMEIFTQPVATKANPRCPTNRQISLTVDEAQRFRSEEFTQNEYGFRRIFRNSSSSTSCKERAAEWTQEVLTAGSDFGEYIEDEKCPSPCSYTSSIRTLQVPKARGQCEVVVEIKIVCGQPKESMEWKSYAIVRNQYTCEPKP